MRRILSIARRAFGQFDRATERLPPLRTITYLPEPVSENRSVTEIPRIPRLNQVEREQIKPGQGKSNEDKANDDDLELQRICEAIGLDVKEVTGKGPSRAATPEARHDESHLLKNDDLSNDVSDDVMKLIGRVEATNAPKPGSGPSAGIDLGFAMPPAGETRAGSLKPTNRQPAQTPLVKASDLADVLASLKLRLLKIRLAPDDMGEAQAEITTAIAQLLSPRPKPQIIGLALKTLLSILETAGPAALTKDVETSLTKLRAYLLQLKV
jgi:hypothetical protein